MRAVRSVLAGVMLAVAFVPAMPAGARVRAAAPTAAPDAYEADDTSATARPLAVPGSGAAALEETRTFSVADTITCDEDWVSFGVSDLVASAGYPVLVEALAVTPGVRPVIEVYAPGTLPSAPASLSGGTDPAAVVASSEASWSVRGGATVELRPDASYPGATTTYRVRVRPAFSAGTGFGAAAGTYLLRVKYGMATRLAGADRYATAARISSERFRYGGVPNGAAVVASGRAFPDALAGSTLAGVLGCPLLLSDPRALPAPTRAELRRLGVRRVYLLGGEGAVSRAVRDSLAGMGLAVVRVSGADRYATAAAVARTAAAPGSTAKLAFLASGETFSDALSASAPAAHVRAPVLLTTSKQLSSATARALADPALGIKDVVIVGGTGAVSAAAEQAVTAIVGAGHVRRLAGANRYATSREVAVWATGGAGATATAGTTATPAAIAALDFTRVGLASGASFADALAGGVFCGLAGAPLLLTESLRVSPYIEARLDPADAVLPGMDYYGAGTQGLTRSYAFGGAGALLPSTFTTFDQLTGARF